MSGERIPRPVTDLPLGWAVDRPMPDDPGPLYVIEVPSSFPDDPRKLVVPRRNVVSGRYWERFLCRTCGMALSSRRALIKHCAQERHFGEILTAEELCPVDRDDDWRVWEDGAGVSWFDRHPEAEE